MSRRRRQGIMVGLFVLAGSAVLAVARLRYLPLLHGTTAVEGERLTAWLEVQPGMSVAAVGAGDGMCTLALARRVGPSGQVYATELAADRLTEMRQAATDAGLSNVTVLAGAVSRTHLPDACCEPLFLRFVHHHLTDPAAMNADLFRTLHQSRRLVIIDFEPGGPAALVRWAGNRRSLRRARHPQGDREANDTVCPVPGQWKRHGELYTRDDDLDNTLIGFCNSPLRLPPIQC